MFPLLYHTHHSLHQEDIPFWLELASHTPGPILELGCGTGRVLLPLARAGHTCWGLDNDPAMLEFCTRQVDPGLHARVHLVQADMRAFELPEKFGLILLPCNTLSTLAELDLEHLLKSVFKHLAPGSCFACSLANPELLRQMPRTGPEEIEETFAHPLDGAPVQVSSTWERDKNLFKLTWAYSHLKPGERAERTLAQVDHHLFSAQFYLDQFKAAGFTNLQVFGDFQKKPSRKRSSQLIFQASK
ncbi:MAG: class I SAM-dependent methyltransferase [Anaerolineales bacterium]|nr:class I SAM-dependent methyltransferase [Anaerolineales bacterium]